MSKLYLDTCIIIDAIKGRTNIFGKNIGNPACDLIKEAISCKYHLIISSWTLEELSKQILPNQATMFFALAKKKIIDVTYNNEDKENAKQRSNDNYDDALHIIIAEKERADYIITRNIDHFIDIGTSITIIKPERLL